MSFISQVVHWVTNIYEPWSAPALSHMRLGPQSAADDNALMMQFFTWNYKHPSLSWWKHVEDQLPALARHGITQIWLPPVHKAMSKEGRGYDAYDLWDLGEFHQKGTVGTRWGTYDDLMDLIKSAQRYGIDILIDAVLNHKTGADEVETFKAVPVDPTNRMKVTGRESEMEGWTKFNFPGRRGKYSTMRWSQEHFTGLDWDHRAKKSGVYRISGGDHRGWSEMVDKELGNYDYLLGVDIDHRHPEVRKDMFAWGVWILEKTGATGFRLDAIKHIDREFLLEFITTTKKRTGKLDMFCVAEYWSPNLKRLLPYVRAFKGQTTFFDVPLHDNFYQASRQGASYDLRKVFQCTLVQSRPGDAVTFVDNHDTTVGQSLESWVSSNFKLQAYALILLRSEGHPCVFYGDLFPNQEGYDERISQNLRLLITARKMFAYGPTVDYFKHRNCIGFVRRGNSKHAGCAVLLSNDGGAQNGSSEKSPLKIRMDVGREHGGIFFKNYLQPEEVIQIPSDGCPTFSCPPGKVCVWIRATHS